MAEAILHGVLKAGLLSAKEIAVADISADRLKYLQDKYKVQTIGNNLQALRAAENILLAVKPQVIDNVLAEINAVNNTQQLIISIAAGVTLEKIDAAQKFRVVRAMPNTPALIGQAATAVCYNPLVTDKDKKFVLKLFQSIGLVIETEEEKLNAVTGLSGSGPAFVFRLMDYFIQAGIQTGLSAEQAGALVYQTFAGSAELAKQSGKTLEELIAQVTSPNGTTQAGRMVLEKSAAAQIIKDTISGAKKRADELAKGK